MTISRETLSMSEARRIALSAQRLTRPPSGAAVGPAAVGRLVEQIGLLQIDSVNVLARAHLLPVYSRLGPYPVSSLERSAGAAPRRLVEAWAHVASYVPVGTFPLLAWRRQAYERQAWGSISSVARTHPEVVRGVRDIVAARGPVTAVEVQRLIEHEHPRERALDWGWNWSVAKRCLELLFFVGEVSSAGRTASFERRYDLTERVLPASVLAHPDVPEADAVRSLLEIGARAHGIGTVRCFQDYFRLSGPGVRTALAELVEEGTLRSVVVRGWDRPVYVHRDATIPRRADAVTLLSPFDPLVFERRRLAELFGVDYRIEIYTPEHLRVHGYYVLPILVGERIVGRLDLKAARDRGELVVRSASFEPSVVAEARPGETDGLADRTHAELERMAAWLGLGDVVTEADARGDLAAALRVRGSRATPPAAPA